MNGSHHHPHLHLPTHQPPNNPSFSPPTMISTLKSAGQKISTNKFIRTHVNLILLITALILLYLCLHTLHTHMIISVYKTPISISNQSLHKQFYTSFPHFLSNQHVRTLIHIQCTLQCFLNLNHQLNGINVTYVDFLHSIQMDNQDVSLYADWINYYAPSLKDLTDDQLRAVADKLRRMGRMGVSIIWEYADYNRMSRDEIIRIRSIFASTNLTYNTIESLQLRRLEGRAVEIFTRFARLSETFDGTENEFNLMAIQTEVKLQRDIPFLREWIGYHATIGVDKFFIYRLPDDEQECADLDLPDVEAQWLKIWQDYSSSIVYIPWQPSTVSLPFPLSLVFSSTTASEHDYIYNFGKEISYTIFLPPDSLMFSKVGLKLSKTLNQLRRFDNFHLQVRHFLQRYCTGSRYMLENYQYYDYGNTHSASINLFQTSGYKADWGSKGGRASESNSHTFTNKEWRVNRYSFSKRDVKQLQAIQKYPNLYLSFDYSAESRIPLISRICDYKYSITVEETCYADHIDCINRHGTII